MSETENVPASECWFECGALGGGTDMGICLDYTDTDNTPCPDGVRTGGRTTKTLPEEAFTYSHNKYLSENIYRYYMRDV